MNDQAEVPSKHADNEDTKTFVFEIFVQPGFLDLELSAVITVLRTANDVLNSDRFSWQITSDEPGLVSSSSGLMARADPAISDQYLRDCLIVVAGRSSSPQAWIARLRAMQKLQRRVVLLSDASREYVRAVKNLSDPTTAHWRDVSLLREIGSYPMLTDQLAELNGSVLTCAGHGHTLEAMIGVLADQLGRRECAEIASLLVLDEVRGFSKDQPKGSSYNPNYFEKRLQNSLRLMETNIEQPLRLGNLAKEVGLSTRHLERLFTVYFNTTPAKLYKKIRLKKAHTLVVDTRMPQIEIALSCGFSTAASFSQAYKAQYGETPTQRRKRSG
ncbi:GlxA family transcriptional regulator [Labrenzia sp. PHM005]|uniref:GlxA family transcriptional regulator n=1 Tax=Labrenzia sp. PHM005 TaxID=2590016 RepID=UPI0011407F28|nr:helix-turn-helix domain-containing protein [Labrenzia sp. PHM005]QDG78282.1 helix-turn-helix domain-containing protein [Labrenzia sp. PHM005]